MARLLKLLFWIVWMQAAKYRELTRSEIKLGKNGLNSEKQYGVAMSASIHGTETIYLGYKSLYLPRGTFVAQMHRLHSRPSALHV
jgi:hypothetical protein